VKHRVKRLVFSSSASVYGNAVEVPMTELHPFNNRTFYGATKIAGEQILRAFYERYGLDYVGIRYMNVYGPRQDHRGAYVGVIMKMMARISANQNPVVFGDGSQMFDFIYVEDAARANVLALRHGRADTFYNVGSGEGATIRQVAELLLEVTGREDLRVEFRPARQEFVTKRIGSTALAETELGFRTQVGLREGLQRLYWWWQRDVRTPEEPTADERA
jgi:UDP-glucose 4-epimerase